MNTTRYARRRLAVLAAGIAVIAGGLTLGANLPEPGVQAPTPTVAQLAATSCQEDMECWNCEDMGNRICPVTDDAMAAAAWDQWDAYGGANQLLVNPHAKVTLTGYSRMDPYSQGAPELGVQQLAVPGAEVWFIFTAEAI
jgi:hypothetical protein